MKKHIPNIITCGNLLSGALAVVVASYGLAHLALLFILLGALFDFFDGMVARLLNVSQEIGKELDSLADNITFGLAPTITLFIYLTSYIDWWALIVLLMAPFSALRLAKFNLDKRQTESFIGLATPANAIFWASLVAYLTIMEYQSMWLSIVLIIYCLFSCWLLVAELPFFSLKFHNLTWAENKTKYIFLISACSLICAAIVTAALTTWNTLWLLGAAVIIWYVLLALIYALQTLIKR